MPIVLLQRALAERSVADDAGNNVKEWVAGLSSSTVFGFTVGVAFFLSVIFFAIVTSVCRLMFNRRGAQPQNRWVRLEDGSSLQVPVGSRGSSYFGPVETLMRRQDEHGYVPARSGQPPREMSVDGGVGMSQFVAYDPPLARSEASESSYPPSVLIPGARPASTATDRSSWSDFTYVAAEGAEKMDDDEPKPSFAKDTGLLYLPGEPLPPPPPPQAAPVTGEALFSAPKPAPNSSSPAPSYKSTVVPPHTRSPSVPSIFATPSTPPRPSHTRTPSAGFTPRPLGLASAAPSASVGRTASLPALEAPKVDLKRTWSVSSWMPNQFLSKESPAVEKSEGASEEAAALVQK